MRGDPILRFDDALKRATNLTLNSKVPDTSKALGMNVLATEDKLLMEAVTEAHWDRWNEDNKDAIADYDARIEREGTFSRRVQLFLEIQVQAGDGGRFGAVSSGLRISAQGRKDQVVAGRSSRWMAITEVLTLPRVLPPTEVRIRGTADSRPGDRPKSGIGARRHLPAHRDRLQTVFSGPPTNFTRLRRVTFAVLGFTNYGGRPPLRRPRRPGRNGHRSTKDLQVGIGATEFVPNQLQPDGCTLVEGCVVAVGAD
jgi:antitoxin CcdA